MYTSYIVNCSEPRFPRNSGLRMDSTNKQTNKPINKSVLDCNPDFKQAKLEGIYVMVQYLRCSVFN